MKGYRYLYGPVPSRRLGRSLGIDLVPHKICTYDCIYCQIGKTTGKTLLRKPYVPMEEILEEVKAFLREESALIDYLSLGGSGEPTLHSGIDSIIKGLKTITSIPVAVITNGSLLCEKEVREDLLQADVVLPSLDAISPETFERINRPFQGFSIERVIEGMVEFRKIYHGQIWLEILFCKGVNDTPDELQRMKEVVERIEPDRVDLNTVVRPPSSPGAIPLNQEEMRRIRNFFGEKASVISEFNRHPPTVSQKEMGEKIVRILRRRPLSLSDLSQGMGIAQDELKDLLRPLIEEGRIRDRFHGDLIYYGIPRESEKP